MKARLTAFGLLLLILGSLSGCVSSKLLGDMGLTQRVQTANLLPSGLPTHAELPGSASRLDARAQSEQNKILLRHARSPHFAGQIVPIATGDALPKILDTPQSFNYGQQRATLATVAARLSKLTGIPVRIRPDVYTGIATTTGGLTPAVTTTSSRPISLSPSSLPPTLPALPAGPLPGMGTAAMMGLPQRAQAPANPTPPAGTPDDKGPLQLSPANNAITEAISIDAIPMQWRGTVRDYLDHLTAQLSLSWEYTDKAIVIGRIIAHSYTIASIPGQQKFSMSAGGAGTGSGGGQGSSASLQSSAQLSENGSSDTLKAMLETIGKLIQSTPGSSYVLNEQIGTLVVLTSKDVHAQIRDYIDAENRSLRQTVSVTFDIYSIKTGEQQQQGFNLSGLKGNLSITGPSTLADSTAGIFKLSRGENSAILNLLQTQGRSVQHRPISVITQNGRWDTKTRLSTIAYLKETTPGLASPTGVAGAPGLKTDTLTIGDQYAVLPIVQPDGTLFLKYSIILSDLVGMFEVSAGAGASLQKVQTPKTDSVSASSTLHLASGETAVITGLSRIVAGDDNTRLGQDIPILLGGSNKARFEREHFLILVRATLL